jgi:hypothetical protein
MQDYNKINNITGWLMFAIATIVYVLTVEPTASYWDCGEFIAVSYKLEVPHPPGAPLFLLIGRLFSFLALGDTSQVAYWINMVSVLSSSFTILFLFWSITHLAKKLVKETDTAAVLVIMGSGVVGAMAYTFSDSFWFSAVEAEVYGMSSFFTAFVVWAILKWENIEDSAQQNRWMILIAYMVGLSIGVHLLNLVTLPALGLIYYYKKYDTVSLKGIFATLFISGVIIIVILEGVIPGIPSFTAKLEILFVNSFGLPFGSGVVFFLTIFLGSLIYCIYYSIQKSKITLNTVLVSFAFILIGYSSYTIVLIRSNYNPPIDENSPDDILSYVKYLKREQYGSRPLFYGQYFTAELIDQVQGDPEYVKGEDKYEISDHKLKNIYDPKHSTIFPRAYSNSPNHIKRYREIMNLKQGEKPTFIDNLEYMFKHQLGFMYIRYFMWNFAGRASDIQGAGWIGIADAFDKVPTILDENRGRNIFFMLPLMLGLIGLFFQYYKDQKNFFFVAMLFFLTGAAIVLYLNTPPVEPRERDYIYAASYYAFAFWIGLGMLGLFTGLNTVLKNRMTAGVLALALSMIAPAIMAAEGWDDHDRSDRYFSVDSAKNFLASCQPNAIIFTGGDNDTFPLWYVQEVEGFRTDVRVVVLSYFNTDWYIEQMMNNAYDSQPLPFGLPLKAYEQGGRNDYLPLLERPNLKKGIDAKQFIDLIRKEHPGLKYPMPNTNYNSVPSKLFHLNIDTTDVLAKGIIPEQYRDMMVSKMSWSLKGRALEKKDLAILDLIATNNWERPIYFNNTSSAGVNLNLRSFMVQEGNAFRLLPIKNTRGSDMLVDTDVMFDNVMNNFHWRNLDKPEVYYNEDYRNFVLNHRANFSTLAEALMAEGKMEKAKEALLKCLELMPDAAIPYDHFNVQQIGMLVAVGEIEKAKEMAAIVSVRADEMLTYLVENNILDGLEMQKSLIALSELARAFRATDEDELANKYEQLFRKHYDKAG